MEYKYLRSSCLDCSVLQCVSTLLKSVLMQLILCCVGWLLLSLNIWSVCAFLRYTCVFKMPLSVFVISMSKNTSLFSCSSSLVNLMFLVVLLIVCKMSSVLSFLTVYIPVPCFDVIVVDNSFTFQVLHNRSSKETGKWRPHWSTRYLLVVVVLKAEFS